MRSLILSLLFLSLSLSQSKILTQTGYWTQRFDISTVTANINTKSPLSYKYAIAFPMTFKDLPRVALALNIFDLEATDPGVRIEAQDITKTGFNLYIEVQDNAYLKNVGCQWLATVDTRISVSFISKSSANEARLPTSGTIPGLKEFNVRLLHPVHLTNPSAAVFMAGFGFGGNTRNKNLKLELKNLDHNGVNVIYSTWDDTVLKSASFYLISYEADVTIFQNTTQTNYEAKSKLWDPTYDPEIRYELRYLSIGNETEGTLLGLQQIEFASGSDVRLEMDHRRNGDVIEVKYLTRGDTSIRFAKSTVLTLPMLDSIFEGAKTYTQTGLIGKNFAADGHPFANDDSTDRFIVYRATYPQRFRKTPSLMIGTVGFDIKNNNPGFQIEVIAQTPTDFTIKMTVKAGTILRAFQAGWLATISPNLRITKFTKDLTDADLVAASDGNGNVKMVFPYSHPRTFVSPGVGIAINGFYFQGNEDAHFKATYTDLTGEGFNLVVETNLASRMNHFSLVIMHLEANDMGSAHMVTLNNLAAGLTRDAKAQVYSNAEFFVGINEFNLGGQGDLSFNQDFYIKNSDFTARCQAGETTKIDTLTDLILVVPHNKVSIRLLSQSGRFEKWYKDANHPFQQTPDVDRFEVYEINFDKPFDQIPDVALTITGFDLDGDGIGLIVDVLVAAVNKFTFNVSTFAGTVVNSIELSWYATVNDEVTVSAVKLDSSADSTFKNFFSGSGNRYTNFVVDPNGVEFDNPGAQVMLSGFKFGVGSSPRMYSWVRDVNHDGANVVYGTFGDTVIEKLKFTVVQYEKNNKNTGILTESKYKGGLWKWSGQRMEDVKTKSLGSSGMNWFGLSGFDFEPDLTYKLHQVARDEDGVLTVGVKVWGRSKLLKVTDSIFHTLTAE